MRKIRTLFWMTVLVLTQILPVTAGADIGPKPSVVIDIKGLEGETYYVTLLSEKDSTGPWSKHETLEEASQSYGGPKTIQEEAWTAFNQYEDEDGFYFLGCLENGSYAHQFQWTYYPPETFKVLLYFPESGAFAVTEDIYQRYAFDSYYTLNAEGAEETHQLGELRRSYQFGWEGLSFLARVVLTLAAEMALALAFGFRAKKQLKVIFAANLVTQVILNLLLNFINYRSGPFMLVFHYAWMELVVFLLEGALYAGTLKRWDRNPGKKRHPWGYALAANLTSLLLGILVAHWIPGIF